MDKVYNVIIDCAIDGQEEPIVYSFSSYEKAKAFFDKCVAEEKVADHLMNSNTLQMIDEEAEFSIWEDGAYFEDHYTIRIVETTLDRMG